MIIYTFNFWLPSNYFFLHFRFFFGGVPAETFWLCRATRQWRQQLRSMEKDVVVIIAHTLRWIRDEKFFWLLLEWRREDDSQGLSPLFFYQVDVPVWGFYFTGGHRHVAKWKQTKAIDPQSSVNSNSFCFFKQKKGWNNRTMHFGCMRLVCFISLISLDKNILLCEEEEEK